MMKVRMTVAGTVLGLLVVGAVGAPAAIEGQGPDGRWPLQPSSGANRVVAPFMEGWFENPDGTYSISFGYLNMNDEVVEIPIGENNFIEPAQFNGMQPTYFERGHQRGLFTVNLPASMRDTDVWWNIRNPNGELTRVPGRTSAGAYQLDWSPRPHGTVAPRVSFEGQSGEGYGPPGIMSERVINARVGQRVVLSVNARDVSERDRSDARFRDPIPMRVTWSRLQAPVGAEVTFERHESNPVPEGRGGRGGGAAAAADPDDPDDPDAPPAGGRGNAPPPPQQINLAEGRGTAQVYVTFGTPGEYVMRAQADQFSVPDSSSGDQCCWTNGYVRVNVTQ
jgi:hypothetical protein